MSNHSEGSADLSYQLSLSRTGTANSLFDKHSLTSLDGKHDDYKHTMAYEKGLMKEKCGLCKMYFHRKSVNYKVPNHRIFDLERQWNVKRDGRRYTNPAFLYKMVDVCCFCSQFFKIMPDQLPALEPKEPPPKPLKLDIKTVIERTDIARGQRTYMSSSVDGRTSEMAVSPPYEHLARTRREVDPWWEIDFSRSFHVHSLSFLVSTGKNQKLNVSVFLLDKPYGFEDPFIDSIKGKASASISEVVPASPQSVMMPITWEFPVNTTCFAIRIQLKGIHSLGIQNFKVLQGDNLVLSTEDDFVQTMVSYSSLSPAAVREGYLEMMSPETKKELIREQDPTLDIDHHLKAKHVSVGVLSQQIKRRKHRIKQWKEKVLQFSSIFQPDEVEALYRVIFKPAFEAKPGKDMTALNEQELLGSALIQHYPRCDLGELQTRLRSVTRWIQTRSHLKMLGVLANSHNFDIVSNDPNHHIYHLSTACKRVEIYWGKHELKEERELENAKELGFNGTKASEARGCSWSQFLILISLFLTQKCKSIPDEVFFFDPHTAADVGFYSSHHYNSNNNSASIVGDDHSLYSEAASLSHNGFSHSALSLASSVGGNNWLNQMATSTKFNPPEVVVEQKTLLQQAREAELFPYYNSSFAEYKFWHFQRRSMITNIDFPPDLSLEFARSLNPKRASTSSSATRPLATMDLAQTAPEGNLTARTAGTHNDDASVHSGLSKTSSPEQRAAGMGMGSPAGRPRLNAQRSMIWNAAPGEPSAFTGIPMREGASTKMGRTMSMKFMRPSPSSPNLLSQSVKLTSMANTKNLANSLSQASLDGSNSRTPRQQGSPSRPGTSASVKMSSPPTNNNSRPGTREWAKPKTAPVVDDASLNSSDLLSFGDSSKAGEAPAPLTTIDFFRVCNLCEVKFPRDCMEVKVMRKHVVNLRMSWDPALVSKEIRLLDHTISMYSLVHVCTFCSQFFDPDFPDGIAYPIRVDSPVPKTKGALQAIASQNMVSPLIKYYDTRYVANPIEVGEVFTRPKTVDARARAQRALAISDKYNARQAEIALAATMPVK